MHPAAQLLPKKAAIQIAYRQELPSKNHKGTSPDSSAVPDPKRSVTSARAWVKNVDCPLIPMQAELILDPHIRQENILQLTELGMQKLEHFTFFFMLLCHTV